MDARRKRPTRSFMPKSHRYFGCQWLWKGEYVMWCYVLWLPSATTVSSYFGTGAMISKYGKGAGATARLSLVGDFYFWRRYACWRRASTKKSLHKFSILSLHLHASKDAASKVDSAPYNRSTLWFSMHLPELASLQWTREISMKSLLLLCSGPQNHENVAQRKKKFPQNDNLDKSLSKIWWLLNEELTKNNCVWRDPVSYIM